MSHQDTAFCSRSPRIEARQLIAKAEKCYISLHLCELRALPSCIWGQNHSVVLCSSRKRMASKLRDTFGLAFFCLLLLWSSNPKFVIGIPWNEPQQTSTISAPQNHHAPIPRPTAIPLAPHDLLIRQDLPLFPTVCGYIDGEFCKLPSTIPEAQGSLPKANPVTCATGFCGSKPSLSAVGCCTSYYVSTSVTTLDWCYFETACYDSTDMNLCTGACLTNTQVVRWYAPLFFVSSGR